MFRNYFKRLGRAVLGRDNEARDLRDFNQRYQILDHDYPGYLTPRLQEERWRYLTEEVTEFRVATSIDEQADALVDIVYIAKGTARMMGLPWEALWDDVQRANMAKVLKSTERSVHDITKPPGWMPPNGWEILCKHGIDMFYADVSDVPTAQQREHSLIKATNLVNSYS